MRILSSLIVGLCLLIGLALAGYLVGKGGTRFKGDLRTVTVKGLAEREVKADQVVWRLAFRHASNDMREAQARVATDRDAALAFLRQQAVAEGDITREPTRTLDKQAREYGGGPGENPLRYIATGAVVVKSADVAKVQAAIAQVDALLQAGIVLDAQQEGGAANPRYVLSRFNDLRPALLADATRNARTTAEQFAADGGARIGAIRSANQGVIQIFGPDGSDESSPYSPTSSPVKRVRVVSTLEFDLH